MVFPDLDDGKYRLGILLAIDDALLEGGHCIGPVHVDRIGAELLEDIEEDRRTYVAEFEALHVGGRGDHLLAVGHLPEAVFAPREELHATLFKFLEDHLA